MQFSQCPVRFLSRACFACRFTGPGMFCMSPPHTSPSDTLLRPINVGTALFCVAMQTNCIEDKKWGKKKDKKGSKKAKKGDKKDKKVDKKGAADVQDSKGSVGTPKK